MIVAIVLSLAAVAAFAADPGAAIAKAKTEIAAGNHAAATRLLNEALAGAASMTNLRDRAAALSAIHFYGALAASGAGNQDQARAELRSFFLYSPASKLDTSRFPAEFGRLFTDVRQNVERGRANPASFDDAYPGFPPSVSSSTWPLQLWGASSEFMILATPEEKTEWGKLADDAARQKFMDAFWLARDPDPATKVNEARIEFLRRVAFADVAFDESADHRGSLTDRGRVFVLLGPPRRVTIRPLRSNETNTTPSRSMDAGSAMEQWTYFREELPKALPHNEVVYRFMSEGGAVARRLQHDFMAEKALRDAPGALRRD